MLFHEHTAPVHYNKKTVYVKHAELQSEVLVCKIKFLGADFG